MRHVRKYFKIKTIIDIYYTFSYPHLIYGLEFWGHAHTAEPWFYKKSIDNNFKSKTRWNYAV